MAKQAALTDVARTAKKLWTQATREVEPLRDTAMDIAMDSALKAKRLARNARRVVQRNPWTVFGVAALVMVGTAAAVIAVRRQRALQAQEQDEEEDAEEVHGA